MPNKSNTSLINSKGIHCVPDEPTAFVKKNVKFTAKKLGNIITKLVIGTEEDDSLNDWSMDDLKVSRFYSLTDSLIDFEDDSVGDFSASLISKYQNMGIDFTYNNNNAYNIAWKVESDSGNNFLITDTGTRDNTKKIKFTDPIISLKITLRYSIAGGYSSYNHEISIYDESDCIIGSAQQFTIPAPAEGVSSTTTMYVSNTFEFLVHSNVIQYLDLPVSRYGGTGDDSDWAISAIEIRRGEAVTDVCFLKGTPILTDQGEINIENLTIHNTINNQTIRHVSKTINADDFMILIHKNAFGDNVPSRKTYISKNHTIFVNNNKVKAIDLLNGNTVKKVILGTHYVYNVVLDSHGKMSVNNLTVESLDPETLKNIIDMYPFYKKKTHFVSDNNTIKSNVTQAVY